MFEKVIKKMVKTLDDGRVELFSAAENVRNECPGLNEELKEIDRKILNLDNLIAESGAMNRSGKSRYMVQRNRLLGKKTKVEEKLYSFQSTIEKAENMVSRIGMVMDFLSGDYNDLNLRFENLQQRQQLSLQIIRAQEEERKRMARDIHDGPAQSMANVVFRIEFCEKLLDIEPDRIREELRELKEVIKDNLQDVRKIIFDLRPMALDDLGLAPAIKRYVDNFRESSGLKVNFHFFGQECRLEPALEIVVFRLIQECLNNIVKHAEADEVTLTLKIKPDFITVVVEDNGKGFDLSRHSLEGFNNHFGLISMDERASLLGGEMKIKTEEGKGTKVSFRLPVKQQSKAIKIDQIKNS